jgi:hypothetical protein
MVEMMKLARLIDAQIGYHVKASTKSQRLLQITAVLLESTS